MYLISVTEVYPQLGPNGAIDGYHVRTPLGTVWVAEATFEEN